LQNELSFSSAQTSKKKPSGYSANTSHEDLLLIPDGFNNNLYWNIAHTVATQQLLHYYLSGNPFRIDKYWIETYKKGRFRIWMFRNLKWKIWSFYYRNFKNLMKDYDSDFFSDYTPYTTSFGMDLKSIQDAIIFNNMHESLHYGYVMAQKRAILGEKGR
jgi:hypothetical protein